MRCMAVTLDVLKLSGWLNADAPLNMPRMEGTLEVSTLSGWLNGGEAGRDAGRQRLAAETKHSVASVHGLA